MAKNTSSELTRELKRLQRELLDVFRQIDSMQANAETDAERAEIRWMKRDLRKQMLEGIERADPDEKLRNRTPKNRRQEKKED